MLPYVEVARKLIRDILEILPEKESIIHEVE